MGIRRMPALAGLLALVLLAAPGCVTKKLFRDNVDDTDGRIASVESAVEDNAKRLGDLKKDTDTRLSSLSTKTDKAVEIGNSAMGEAKAAKAASQGKLLWQVMLSDDAVKFDFGKANLTSAGIAKIDAMVSKVKNYGKALYLEIEGHTDSVGTDKHNAALGEARAMAVRNYLNEKHSIPLHVMSTISYGEERPIADNSTKGGREQNRRVVIRVLE